MNLSDEDIVKILKIVEESEFDSLHLECNDLVLRVSKTRNAWQPGSMQQVFTMAPVAIASPSLKAEEELVQPEKITSYSSTQAAKPTE